MTDQQANNTSSANINFWLVAGFVLLAGILRLLFIEVPNFAPIAAMALFGGAYIKNKKLAYLLPIVVMFATDLILQGAFMAGLREWPGLYPSMIYVYASFILIGLLGTQVGKKISPATVLGGGVLASVLFFAITNFGVWASGMGYPMTIEGLIACYIAAVPFYQFTVFGDLFFVVLFFGGVEFVRSQFPKLAYTQV